MDQISRIFARLLLVGCRLFASDTARSRSMNALQLFMTIFHYHSGWQVCMSVFMLLYGINSVMCYYVMLLNKSV